MNNYRIAFGLCLLASSLYLQDAQASSWVTEKLEARINDEAQQLAPELEKINDYSVKHLKRKFWEFGKDAKTLGKRYARANEIIQFVKSAFPSKNQARNKLISLKGLARSCNLHSLEVFATLDLAIGKLEPEPIHVTRVVRHYWWDNAIYCGPIYKQNYDKLRPSLEMDEQFQRDSELVHAALDELETFDIARSKDTANNHDSSYQQMYLFKMPAFKFGQEDLKAVQKIAVQIGKQLAENQQWDFKSLDDAHLKKALDEYLFEPCARFRNRQKDVLEPALMLAQYEICKLGFREDPQYFRTVLDFGLCEKLLDEREQLYAKFSQLLRNPSPDQLVEAADRV